jgi:hypothetical protein
MMREESETKRWKHTGSEGHCHEPQGKRVVWRLWGPTSCGALAIRQQLPDIIVDEGEEAGSLQLSTVLAIILVYHEERSPEGGLQILVVNITSTDFLKRNAIDLELIRESSGTDGARPQPAKSGTKVEHGCEEPSIEMRVIGD